MADDVLRICGPVIMWRFSEEHHVAGASEMLFHSRVTVSVIVCSIITRITHNSRIMT